jgi:hypothetical protein
VHCRSKEMYSKNQLLYLHSGRTASGFGGAVQRCDNYNKLRLLLAHPHLFQFSGLRQPEIKSPIGAEQDISISTRAFIGAGSRAHRLA